jgi:hypothetical protein
MPLTMIGMKIAQWMRMNRHERLDYADQEPLSFPTPTGLLGSISQFL